MTAQELVYKCCEMQLITVLGALGLPGMVCTISWRRLWSPSLLLSLTRLCALRLPQAPHLTTRNASPGHVHQDTLQGGV